MESGCWHVEKRVGLKSDSFRKDNENVLETGCLSIVVLGASGDLAKKKTFPALFNLFRQGFLQPDEVHIFGYARTKISDDELRNRIRGYLINDKNASPEHVEKLSKFLELIKYVSGSYDSEEGFRLLDKEISEHELSKNSVEGTSRRLFYLALPPSVYPSVCKMIRNFSMNKSDLGGWTRIVVEKPFGKDLESAEQLSTQIGELFEEPQIYRIDHYLGKELVQNLLVLRFANRFFLPLWNRDNIDNVQIVFREDFGTDGRGGYFDEYGIIRDIIQNHLLQVFCLVAMEKPVSLKPEYIRDEKVKVLQSVLPIKDEEVVLGQYDGYRDDPTVPDQSNTPTFATVVLRIHNERWEGVPFVLKAGKALNSRKAEIRVQFKDVPGDIFKCKKQGRNEFVPFPQFTTLKLASCNLKILPDFLKTQSNLTFLDLSINQINGNIPSWIWKLHNLIHLNLSYNNLVMTLERPNLNISSLSVLDLRSNQLEGKLPVLPPFATYLDFSRNNFNSTIPANVGNFLPFAYFFSLASNTFQGGIPQSLCNAAYLRVLDLSNNSLNGTIPKCLIEMSVTLGVLDVRRNKLSGTINDIFPGNCGLQTLNLNGNLFEGVVPRSLENCKTLEVFDIGNNHIKDGFPCYLRNISKLRVLVLRSNEFYGPIGCRGSNVTWPMLQILDLASNNFTGQFPRKSFSTWKAMMDEKEEDKSVLSHLQFEVLHLSKLYYQDMITVTIKGLSFELVKILTIFTSIDISCNNLDGPIPEDIGALKSIYVLNFSHNAFIGKIPPSLGNLTPLESLDLSGNKLTGEIPIQLANSLTFLSFLNLSFNHLLGPIPFIKQFATFSELSYEGNEGLCGGPLTKKCKTLPSATPEYEHKASTMLAGFDWQFILTGLGFGVGAAVVVTPLTFWEKGRKWHDNSIDKILLVILPMMGLSYTCCYKVKVEAEEDIEDENKEDCEDDDENEEFHRRYCVICSKLDISRKRVIHDPQCTCHNSPPISSSSSTSSSSS